MQSRLHAGDSGEIVLPSGHWSWNVMDMGDMPSGPVDTRYVWLHHAVEERSRMMLRLSGAPDLNGQRVAELAKNPAERTFVDPTTGVEWTFTPFHSDTRKVQASRTGHPALYVDLPDDRGLGELGVTDLMDLVQDR